MNGMQKKVVDHYRQMARRMPRYIPRQMAELAPGIIAVEDKSGECDALFDTEQWEFKSPDLWQNGEESESPLGKIGLKVLQGVGAVPRVSTIEAMVNFAKMQLSPKGDETWHESPQFFVF